MVLMGRRRIGIRMDSRLPMVQWLTIVRYGNFHDVPRYILALDRDLVFWLFDCPFDENLDDYRDTFSAFRIGTDSVVARDCYTNNSIAESDVLADIRVEQIEFDDTLRNKMFLHIGLAYPSRHRINSGSGSS